MAERASIELTAAQDVTKGKETSIDTLFLPVDRRQGNSKLREDIQRDKTRIKVTISKVGSFETKANTTKKKWEVITCAMLLSPTALLQKITANADVKKGDKLTVSLETA